MEYTEIITLEKWYELSEMANGKRQVMLAALHLFADNGINNTSTAQIAKQAGVSQATIFKYFHTKDELLMAILDPLFNNLFSEYKSTFKDKISEVATDKQISLQQVIYTLVKDRFNIVFENRNAVIILITGILIDDKIRQRFVSLLQTGVSEIGPKLLELLSQFSEFNQDLSLYELLRIFIGQIASYFIMHEKILPDAQYDVENDVKRLSFELYRAITK